MKKLSAILGTVVLIAALAACGSNSTKSSTQGSSQEGTTQVVKEKKSNSSEAKGDTRMFTDSCGREVELPVEITRIVPAGNMAQQFLVTLGGDKLVGMASEISGDAAKYIGNKYSDLPKFGSFYGSEDLNMEAVAAADPQVIIDIGEYKKGIEEDMDDLQEQIGIPVIFVEASTDTMADAYATLGDLLGEKERGQALSQYCSKVYNDITTKMASIPESDRVKTLYVLGDTGTNVMAKGVYFAEVIDMVSNNLAVIDNPTSKGSGNEVSAEQIMLWNPDFVIFGADSIYDKAKTDDVWSKIGAIQNGKYREIVNYPYNWLSGASVTRYMGLQWLANELYPDVFKYDMYKATSEFYKLFYGYDLSQNEYNELTVNTVK